MTPSNANTSGLAEIAYARIENGQLLDLSRMSWGNYEPLVTAASAQARIAELERALKPFAAMAEAGDQRPKDDAVWAGQDGKRITFGDFRRAAEAIAALKSTAAQEGGSK